MKTLKISIIAGIFSTALSQGTTLNKQPKAPHFYLQALPKGSPSHKSYCFFPSFPQTGLVTYKDGEPLSLTLLKLKNLKEKLTWKTLSLGNLPQTTKATGLTLGRVPFLGETPNYGIAWASPGVAPSFIDHSPFFQASTIEKAPALGIPILSTDLDRDGLPELWAMNPDTENQDAAPAFLYTAPHSEEPNSSPIPELNIGGGFAGVLVFDFDGDFLEDFLLFGPGKKVALVFNKGNMSWSLAQDASLPQGIMGTPLKAQQLFLSPIFSEKQWLLAQSNQKHALLLERNQGNVFKPLVRDLGELNQGIRDARFLDMNMDGTPELWVLTEKGLYQVSLFSEAVDLVRKITGGGQRILIGDINGDLAPDFCILRENKPALLLLNKPTPAAIDRSVIVSLEGIEEFPHAIGAYVELLLGDKVLQRHRWPPQRTDDALALYFSLPTTLSETPSFRVTWPDGNVSESEVKPGTHLRLKH